MTPIEPIIWESAPSPRHTIIWLHGLGADGSDFVPVAQAMQLPVAVRYIFPHAPHRPITINGGYVMRGWYDILSADFSARLETGNAGLTDVDGIRASQAVVEELIAQEKQRGIAAKNIFLAGFSQGGAIILYAGLRHAEPLGGLIALSTYLPLADRTAAEIHATPPVFIGHGREDTIIPSAAGKRSAKTLAELGCAVEWHDYPMPHSVCMEELRDLQDWLIRRTTISTLQAG
ncbi:MAG: alpha/beta hydrolase [Gallionellaceae bacterium]|jgi:phospholipase/carboxylesterase|nr:alpha/beta hydrolase [Gallionellaceae bacterium]